MSPKLGKRCSLLVRYQPFEDLKHYGCSHYWVKLLFLLFYLPHDALKNPLEHLVLCFG